MKAKFYRQFYLFAIYFFVSLFAFTLRPRAIGADEGDGKHTVTNTTDASINDTTNSQVKSLIYNNLTEILCNYTGLPEALVGQPHGMNTTEMYDNITMPTKDNSDEWTSFSDCPLLDISTLENRVSILPSSIKSYQHLEILH